MVGYLLGFLILNAIINFLDLNILLSHFQIIMIVIIAPAIREYILLLMHILGTGFFLHIFADIFVAIYFLLVEFLIIYLRIQIYFLVPLYSLTEFFLFILL